MACRFVSLGGDGQVARHIRRLKLDSAVSPFDDLIAPLRSVIPILDTGFERVFDAAALGWEAVADGWHVTDTKYGLRGMTHFRTRDERHVAEFVERLRAAGKALVRLLERGAPIVCVRRWHPLDGAGTDRDIEALHAYLGQLNAASVLLSLDPNSTPGVVVRNSFVAFHHPADGDDRGNRDALFEQSFSVARAVATSQFPSAVVVERILAAPSRPVAMRQFLLAHHLTDPSACAAVFESAMARADVASYWAYYMMVEAYLRIGNAGAAYLLATIAERLEPAEQSWHLYHCMATYLLSHGREADAVSVLRRHLEKTPENPVIESAVIESLFARNGAALPRPAALRLGALATATVRRIPVTESSVLEMTVPTPIGGATLALGSLRARMARPAITVTELLDALVIIQNGAILVIDSDAALQLPLCGAGFPIQVLARHERLLDEGAVIEERAVASAVILKDHFKSHNVCHLLLDYMTRLELYRRAGADIAETAVITEPLSQPFMSAIAEAFGVREIISCNQRIRLRVGRLLVSDNCKATFRHPAHLAAPWAVDYIRRAFGADDADADVRDQKLYISRRDAGSRRIRNEQAVADVLRDAGFRIVASSELLYSEQVSLFRRASHVVGMHGAGLTNIVFCAPGTEVLEIFHPIGNNASYAILAAGARLRYSALVGLDAESDEPLWNDPEFPETARRDLGGRDRMNHRDVHVPLDRLHTWLGSAVAPPADTHSPETANMDHADG